MDFIVTTMLLRIAGLCQQSAGHAFYGKTGAREVAETRNIETGDRRATQRQSIAPRYYAVDHCGKWSVIERMAEMISAISMSEMRRHAR
jgi:hypothetical protein